jgi:hypothetical protein
MNLQQWFQKQIQDEGAEEALDIYNWPFEDLPKTQGDGWEPVDFENTAILGIDFSKGTILIHAGGDWQAPVLFTAVWDDIQDQFTFRNPQYQVPWRDELFHMTEKDILDLITGS